MLVLCTSLQPNSCSQGQKGSHACPTGDKYTYIGAWEVNWYGETGVGHIIVGIIG
jgi:hypothetical protein